MQSIDADVIDKLAGIHPGSALDAARARRPQARTHAQATFDALFAPDDPGDMTLDERNAVAAFVAGLYGRPETAEFYAARAPGLPAITQAASGPYGHYPAGPLSSEDIPGPTWRVPEDAREKLGPRLIAAFEHAHLLVFHPRDSSAAALQALLDAGWSTTAIVTLSQLVSFLSYQVRAIAGLRTLLATEASA